MKTLFSLLSVVLSLFLPFDFFQKAMAEETQESWLEPEALEHLKMNTGYVLASGEFEINLVFDYSNDTFLNSLNSRLELQYGISPGFMIEVEIPVIRNSPLMGQPEFGFGDIEIGGKAHLFDKNGVTSAIGFDVAIPTGNKNKMLGGEDVEFEFFWATSFRFEKFSAHAEIGTEFEAGDKPEGGYVNFSLIVPDSKKPFQYQIATKIEIEDGVVAAQVIPGFQIFLNGRQTEGASLGVGFPIGITHQAPNWGVVVNLELEF